MPPALEDFYRVTFGAAYHSGIELELTGRATYEAPTYNEGSFGREPGTAATASPAKRVEKRSS